MSRLVPEKQFSTDLTSSRVTFVVEKDEPLDPLHVSLFGSKAVMPGPNGLVHLIKEFGIFVRHGRGSFGNTGLNTLQYTPK